MKNFLLMALSAIIGIGAFAQSPTIVTPSVNCSVFRSFNTSDEGFSSPSIYSDGNDVSFNWNVGAGAEIENSGLTVRNASLISPTYFVTTPGQVNVGFSYFAPLGTEYRLRIISSVTSPPLEILANTANGPVYTPLVGSSGNTCILVSDADLTAGKAIRFEFTFRLTQPGIFLFDNLALTVAAGPLPVTFEGFVARRNNDGTIKLLWDVGEEVNVKGYYVESSINGVDFTNAGYVPATGNHVYSLDYQGKLVQTMFFRVKSVDIDGSKRFTPIIRVYAKDQSDAGIQLYPMPAKEQVTVQHNSSALSAKITLIGIDGQVVKTIETIPNSLQTQININNLTRGIYLVRYDDGLGKVQTVKLVKN